MELTEEKPENTENRTRESPANKSTKKETSKPWVEASFWDKHNASDKIQKQELAKVADNQNENTTNTGVSIQSINCQDSQGSTT